MSEVEWGSEAKEAPKKKKRIPTWLWFCGGGCLLAVIAAVVIAVVTGMMASKMLDSDAQWEELRKELPFDERPTDLQIVGVGVFSSLAPGIDDQWTLQRGGDLTQVQVTVMSGADADELRNQIESGELGAEAQQRFGPIGFFEVEHGTVDVQGRSIPWLRFQTYEKSGDATEPEPTHPDELGLSSMFKQRLMLLDLTREGASGILLLQFTRIGPGAPVDAADVAEFLAPFHVGPNR